MIQDFGFGFFLRGTVDFPKAYQAIKMFTPLQKGLSAWVIGWPLSSQRLIGLLLYYTPSFKNPHRQLRIV
jgi:hypothetical protein